MSYSCNACGSYVKTGQSHSCYTPSDQTTVSQTYIDSLNEEIKKLCAENEQTIAAWNGHKAVVGSLMQTLEQLRAENTLLRNQLRLLVEEVKPLCVYPELIIDIEDTLGR